MPTPIASSSGNDWCVFMFVVLFTWILLAFVLQHAMTRRTKHPRPHETEDRPAPPAEKAVPPSEPIPVPAAPIPVPAAPIPVPAPSASVPPPSRPPQIDHAIQQDAETVIEPPATRAKRKRLRHRMILRRPQTPDEHRHEEPED
jgi:type IV secretory pathway VirB10-like protein